ncbi:hypothetical protein IT407_04350 [Candidatus Uhrbacteria bacterium]|nr:hypothetical protein [Candidatus Uhrbacteria bacterium]
MKLALRLFMVLTGFGMLFGSALPVLAVDNCWCRKPDSTCEHHTRNASGTEIDCGSSGAASCTAYCTSRGWTAAFCDPDTFIERGAGGGSAGAAGTCPRSSDAATGETDTPTTTEPTRLYNPLGDITVPEFIARGIRAVVGIIGALALLMMVAGGVIWMTAGDSDRVKMAKSMIVNSVIGLLLIFFSYSIISIFFSILRA